VVAFALLNATKALDNLNMRVMRERRIHLRRALDERHVNWPSIVQGWIGIVDGIRRAQQEHQNEHYGYDVLSDTYVDMVAAGIIDPAKVTRSAIQNAASIASMILTTEALIQISRKGEAAAAPAGMPEY